MTFTAVKPSDASPFGSPIHENSEVEVRALISKAQEQAHTLANLSPAQSAALLRAIADSIESQRAALIESADDIKYFMNWDNEMKNNKPKQTLLFQELKPEEKIIVDILTENGETSIDFICNKAQLNNSKIAETLLNLEFAGIIKNLPGKIYKLIQN